MLWTNGPAAARFTRLIWRAPYAADPDAPAAFYAAERRTHGLARTSGSRHSRTALIAAEIRT
jgi:hypothetical protein